MSNPNSLANTLGNSAWKAFALPAFNFVGAGASSISSLKAVETTASDYVEQELESDQGAQQDVGVELALYFSARGLTVTSEFGILADPNLLQAPPRPSSVSRRRPARRTSTSRRRRCLS